MKLHRLLNHTIAGLISISLLSACSGNRPQTLGSLKYKPEPEQAKQLEVTTTVSHQEVRAEYQELLSIIDDQNLKEQIERRIAHVYMLEGEQDQNPAEPATIEQPKSYYVDAIKSYREILEKYPNSPDNAEVLYQLAKAYDMEGNQDEALDMLMQLTTRHPYYANIAEAHFRKGDILFNYGKYAESEAAYRSVTGHLESKFNLNAHYMLGWSQYKQLRYRGGLDSFVYVLNQLLAPADSVEALSKPDQNLVNDTLHAVSLSLDKLAGAAAIEAMPELKDQHYVWMIYDNLGKYYLDKELFEASAESYRLFVQYHSNEDITPILHQKMVDTYVKGSFPRQAFQEKENYVDAYGIYSDYARSHSEVFQTISETMELYLDELARNYHARGQELQTEIEELKENKDRPPKQSKLEELDEEAIVALDKAAYFYLQIVDTFPQHDTLDDFVFLRAEALFSARRFQKSIPDYERVAYRGQTEIAKEFGADAGYAAIIAYEHAIEKMKRESTINQWRGQAVDSMLRFAETYHQDQRSPSVLTNAAEYIFSLEQYPRALDIASNLIINNPDLDTDLKKTAYGIKAHSLFKLERFGEAGENYRLQRQLVAEETEEHLQITERLASAIYKHSETIIASDDKLAAADELLRLKQLTPNSPVRITAQYDAATLLIELQLWSRAIGELQELIAGYPEHELAVEFPRKLAYSFEKNGDWLLAAEEYLQLNKNDPDQNLQRESLYLAAQMYENNEDYQSAIEHFRTYANTHAEPFSTVMEARYKLAQNYQRINDTDKRLFWLQKLVDGNLDIANVKVDSQGRERSRWLGAWANAEYGDYYSDHFDKISLSLPLDKSLPAKYEQLEKASERFQSAAESGIFDFITMSSYKIAALYQDLAKELRQSPRPENLSAEEQNIYKEIIEEQALPLDELAMELHQSNIDRAWDGEFNQWIDQSFSMMRVLNPTRYAKAEIIVSYENEIR